MPSLIEWTTETWNPVIGCDKWSDGCKNCYAREIALRLQRQGVSDYEQGFKVHILPHRLNGPLSWKKPRKIFVNSMSDLFHKDVPFDFLTSVFKIIEKADTHLFQILTKRSENLLALAPKLNWPDNLMMGVTIEANKYRYRLDHLKKVPAKYRFLSLEPLITPIERLDLTGVHQVIVGGESGPNARPMDINWVRNIKDWTKEQNVAFWYKQTSEYKGQKSEPVLDGKYYKEEPDIKLNHTLFDF